MADRPAPPTRTVRPLTPVSTRLPAVAATLSSGCLHEDGTAMALDGLPEVIRRHGPGILVTNDSHRLLLYLESVLGGDPGWQVKVTARESFIARDDDRIRVRKTIVGFLGLQRGNGRRCNHYWHLLDPSIFLDDAKAAMSLPELLLWGDDLQAWCAANGVKVKATAGGIAGQLLRHPRFYPEARRKVPGATNERARYALPGNHYELRASRSARYSADYIDQQSAHHHAALDTRLPDANVYAMGYYRDLRDEPWCGPDEIGDRIGMVRARIWTPGHREHMTTWDGVSSGATIQDYRPSWANIPGTRTVYLFTNELDLLAQLGGRVEYVTAAWLTNDGDPGLNRYARWALAETAAADAARRTWLKRVLLTPYGILAAKPDHFEVGYANAKGKNTGMYPIAGELKQFTVRRSSKPVHPRIAHVIQRGMIEAETRKRSILYANELLAQGQHVLCIYGDGILVRTLPWKAEPRQLLPQPWRWKGRLTNLRFISDQAFESQEIVRLPGIPVAGRDRSAWQPDTV